MHGAQLFLSRLVEHPDLEGCAASEHSPGGVVVRQWDYPTHRIASARPTDRSLLLLRRDFPSVRSDWSCCATACIDFARCSHCDDHREQAQALPHPENGKTAA